MENSGEFNFLNNQGRIGEDELGLSQTNLQNAELNSYMLKNFYLQDLEAGTHLETFQEKL